MPIYTLASCKTLAKQSNKLVQPLQSTRERKTHGATRTALFGSSLVRWEQPQWMLRTALAGSRASKQVEQSLVFKALAAAAAQALIVAAAWRALK